MKQYTYIDSKNQLHHYQIHRLTDKDVLDTRLLWEEVFNEDSPAFTDYYFTHKATHNTTFVCKHDDSIVSMIHMTPYKMQLQGNMIPTFYIVGVATKEDHRHRGLMATLLQEVFTYAKEIKIPFIFLMPVNPAIYEPFGFSYIYARPEYDLPACVLSPEVYIKSFNGTDLQVEFIDSSISDSYLCKLSSFANTTLSEQYDYYMFRTPDYFRTLLFELKSQHGGIYIFKMEDDIVGYMLYANEGRPFIQEMLLSRDLQTSASFKIMSTSLPALKKEKKPIIMAKNICDIHNSVAQDYVNLLSNLKGCINEIV